VDGSKFSRPGVWDDPKWVLEGSRGVFLGFLNTSQPRNRLMEISRNSAGTSSTEADLVSAGVRNRPDVAPPCVVEFGCGKV